MPATSAACVCGEAARVQMERAAGGERSRGLSPMDSRFDCREQTPGPIRSGTDLRAWEHLSQPCCKLLSAQSRSSLTSEGSGAGFPGNTLAMRGVPQSSIRSLDAKRLLRLSGAFLAGSLQGHPEQSRNLE